MKYCIVSKIKKDKVGEYIMQHRQMHKSEFKELLRVIKKSGVEEEVIFIHDNFCIIYFEAEDINKSYDYQRKFEVTQKWDNLMKDLFDSDYKFSNAEKLPVLEKVFDLNEQLDAMD